MAVSQYCATGYGAVGLLSPLKPSQLATPMLSLSVVTAAMFRQACCQGFLKVY